MLRSIKFSEASFPVHLTSDEYLAECLKSVGVRRRKSPSCRRRPASRGGGAEYEKPGFRLSPE
jgi:hypothetical protein